MIFLCEADAEFEKLKKTPQIQGYIHRPCVHIRCKEVGQVQNRIWLTNPSLLLRTNIGNPNTRDSTSFVLRFNEAENLKIQFPPKLSSISPCTAANMSAISENGFLFKEFDSCKILPFFVKEFPFFARHYMLVSKMKS